MNTTLVKLINSHMSNISDPEIQRIRQGLNDLGDAIDQLSRTEAPTPEINNRSLTGEQYTVERLLHSRV